MNHEGRTYNDDCAAPSASSTCGRYRRTQECWRPVAATPNWLDNPEVLRFRILHERWARKGPFRARCVHPRML